MQNECPNCETVLTSSEQSSCPSCGEAIGTVNPFAGPQASVAAKPSVTDKPDSTTPQTTAGVLLLLASIFVAGTTGLVLFSSLFSLFLFIASDRATGGAGLLTEPVGFIVVAAIGFGLAYMLYRGSNEFLYPATHSKLAKLQLIVDENTSLDTTKLEDPTFYLNATDRELFMIYNQPSTQNDPVRLAQIVYEARQRVIEGN